MEVLLPRQDNSQGVGWWGEGEHPLGKLILRQWLGIQWHGVKPSYSALANGML